MLGLYLHIPFCVRKCAYCDFLSFGGCREAEMREYVSLLIRELAMLPRQRAPLSTVFLGGGTPSILPEGEIARLLDAVKRRWPLETGAEVSMECNPGTVTPEKLGEYRAAGVNRLSIGVQSFDDGLLQGLGRIHTAKEAEEAFFMARAAGFYNINLDLMYGLPGQTCREHLATVEKAVALSPEHISMYSLIVEGETEFGRRRAEGTLTLPEEEEEYAMEKAGRELLSRAGYERYEISNYAREGWRCRHNMVYWRCGDYLAAGLGATSSLWEGDRCVMRSDPHVIREYREMIEKGEYMPLRDVEEGKNAAFIALMMGLRMTEGVSEKAFAGRFGKTPAELFPRSIDEGLQKGLLLRENGFLFCSQRGMEIQNDLLSNILEECDAI